jgi:uncharacterized protein with HEPN domain
MVREVRDRLTDIREAASDLLGFVADMEIEAFHALRPPTAWVTERSRTP